ncbi:phage baseplate assembly protein V [uncultured Roseovarius sp.]|uniref:phage baseplate assembly protein V n=1 Tax=uncultured Roseovarius sp. TaxID=293344 RepID=UPI0025E10038|nr:phage baseplate assembly protein V [uncultured Roseovarius sp.]
MYDNGYSAGSRNEAASAGPETTGKWYGKYKGKVVGNTDMTNSGRLKISLPDILKDKEPWADPCVPYAASDKNGLFFMPPTGTAVWIEFEGGDLSKPIWTGFAWDEGKAPSANPDEMLIKTPSGTVKFNASKSGGDVVIETAKLSIVLRDDTVTLTASSTSTIKMQGGSTAINGKGLEVT